MTVLLMLATMSIACAIILIAIVFHRLRGAADRVVAVDALSACGIACCLLAAIASGHTAFLDVAIGFTLIAFLATIGWSHAISRPLNSARSEKERHS